MRVIYLFIEGVLNNLEFRNSDYYEKTPRGFVGISNKLMFILSRLSYETKAKIIISEKSWLKEKLIGTEDYQYLDRKFEDNNIDNYEYLSYEANQYNLSSDELISLDLQKHKNYKYIIIKACDPWDNVRDFDNNCVYVSREVGLSDYKCHLIIDYFKGVK